MRKLLAVLVALAVATVANASVIRTGADNDGASTNSNAAFALWQADVGGVFQTENFNTLTIGGGGTTASTTNGNTFAATSPTLLNSSNFNSGVISGNNLLVDRNSATASFTWTFNSPVNAFGFFGYEHDGGVVTINFNDGSAQQFQTGAVASLFWGISGLNAPISSVTISTNDPGGISNFDNLVTANVAIPEPATLAVFGGLALAGLAGYRRRKAKATA